MSTPHPVDARLREEFVAGNIRQPSVIWEITTRLRLLGDTHIGAAAPTGVHAAESDVDLLIDRDPTNGHPRLRATTLAGLLRHHLADHFGRGDKGAEPETVAHLFGKADIRDDVDAPEAKVAMSPLDLDDAHGELPEHEPVAVRVGNRVQPDSGAVAPGMFWQTEVLPAGTGFAVTLRLHVTEHADEGRLLALLALAADGLSGPEHAPGIQVGARTGRGFGTVRAETWHARRHDVRTPQGWADFFALTWQQRWQRAREALAPDTGAGSVIRLRDCLTSALNSGHNAAAEAARSLATNLAEFGVDQRARDELRLSLAVGERPTAAFLPSGDGDTGGDTATRPGLLMVGDTPRTDDLVQVDRAHRKRPRVTDSGELVSQPLLGDSALFALFKRIGRRLVRELSGQAHRDDWPADSPARTWHTRWWGGEPEDAEAPKPTPARVRLREAPTVSGTELLTTRNTIDALFGDTVDGRLFTDRVHAGGGSQFVLDVREPDDALRGLLALIVRELYTVPMDSLGGGAGVGHGRVAITAAELVRHGPGGEPVTVDLLAALDEPGGRERAQVEEWLAVLRAQVRPQREQAPDRQRADEKENATT
ncbi:RAMP superfamily CRISPR-associated protein [Salinactinospora qingdaonensis]|uniref:CRISPR type III-associated protein domain-containing protein n=1 Tax=Salinactinospora qingdaonensis TaxID=702744 RepID=A0ABP7FVI9_9ACTN